MIQSKQNARGWTGSFSRGHKTNRKWPCGYYHHGQDRERCIPMFTINKHSVMWRSWERKQGRTNLSPELHERVCPPTAAVRYVGSCCKQSFWGHLQPLFLYRAMNFHLLEFLSFQENIKNSNQERVEDWIGFEWLIIPKNRKPSYPSHSCLDLDETRKNLQVSLYGSII